MWVRGLDAGVGADLSGWTIILFDPPFGLERRAGLFFGRVPADVFLCFMSSVHRGAPRFPREQRASSGGDISVPHQAFTDQKRGNPDALQARKICRGIESALGYNEAATRDFRRQLLAHGKRRFKRAQIAIVDAN